MSDDFLPANRATGIGGSEAAAVAGVDPWSTAYELFLRKRGELPPVETTEPMRWGTLLEPVIAEEYARRTGVALVKPQEMLRSEKYPWMIGHLDRIVLLDDRLLECKTSRLPIGWGESGTDEIPVHYAAQVHHYMILGGFEVADVAVLIGGSDFRIYTVEANPAIATMLIEQERLFWEMLQRGQAPEPANMRDAVRRWGRLDTVGRVEAGPDELEAIARLRWLRDQKRDFEADEEALKTKIMTALGDTGDALVDERGITLATWRIDNGRKAYSVEARDPARRFLLKD